MAARVPVTPVLCGVEAGALLVCTDCLYLCSYSYTCGHTVHTLVHKHGYRQSRSSPTTLALLEVRSAFRDTILAQLGLRVCLSVAPAGHGIGLSGLLMNCRVA